jgi:hypothetical protein
MTSAGYELLAGVLIADVAMLTWFWLRDRGR